MASPIFFSDGHTPKYTDPKWRILQKILGALDDGAGGGAGVLPGVLWIYWEAAHVDDTAPANPLFSYMRRFLNGDPPVIWNPTTGQWL